MTSCKEKDLPVESKNTGETRTYSYYSNELKQVFDSVEELKAAESKLHEEQEAKEKARLEKTADAKVVEDAYKHLLEVKAKAAKEIEEAEKMYYEKRNEFIQKHGSYHMTYTNRDGEEFLSVSDLIDSVWNAFGSPFRLL